jgi:hypothetical protein
MMVIQILAAISSQAILNIKKDQINKINRNLRKCPKNLGI